MPALPDDPDLVIVAGDWHGYTPRACQVVDTAAHLGAPVVLQAGDFGYGFPTEHFEEYLDLLEKRCAETDVLVAFIDGNREDHNLLDSVPVHPGTGLRHIREHIVHLPRGHRWVWHDKTWLALGGAFSVTKPRYVKDISWWEQESITDTQVTSVIAGGPADVMLTHDCPDDTGIMTRLPHLDFGPDLLAAAARHRRSLGIVVDAARPELLFHGHYHVRYIADRELPDGARTRIEGLSDHRDSLESHAVVLAPKTLETVAQP